MFHVYFFTSEWIVIFKTDSFMYKYKNYCALLLNFVTEITFQKAILLLDNAPGYLQNLEMIGTELDVTVIYILPNTTTML